MRRNPGWRSVISAVIGILAGLAIVGTTLFTAGPYMTLNSRTYAYETEYLFGNQSYLSFPFRGVTFTFHLWCQVSGDTGIVCGNATESDGVTYSYSFSDGLPTLGPPPWQTWGSPDDFEAVEYQQGGHARLLVEAP